MLPHWSTLAQQIILVQPPLVAAERVFSYLSSSFGDQQTNAMPSRIISRLPLHFSTISDKLSIHFTLILTCNCIHTVS